VTIENRKLKIGNRKPTIMYEQLKKAVYEANLELQKKQLVIYSWGNVSGIDREANVVAIKPSGVMYEDLSPEKIVLLDLDGKIIEGQGDQPEGLDRIKPASGGLDWNKPAFGGLRPSSDTPTHLELYRNFKSIGGVCHTHSPSATAWAQACKEIPCFGTTHADYFYGPVPVTEVMTDDEIKSNYELNTGKVIVRRFTDLDPQHYPGVLVANHGPFTWGKTPADAVESNAVLELVAKMALDALTINPNQRPISKTLLDKHYLRKHGKTAYYGQKTRNIAPP
jgi:L-ribulose-5-phosphate 4-epimerase